MKAQRDKNFKKSWHKRHLVLTVSDVMLESGWGEKKIICFDPASQKLVFLMI